MENWTIHRYLELDKSSWNEFVRHSRNGSFLFDRDYLEYHQDRFPDCSFLFLNGSTVRAVIPGTISSDGVFSSHAGLTYGGFILDDSVGSADVGLFFDLLDAELRKLNAKEVIYKPLPWIYAERPSQEDLYWLFRKGATLSVRLLSCALEPAFSKASPRKVNYLHRGERSGLTFAESRDFSRYWDLLDACLSQGHSSHPVHSKAELELLSARFPENIRLFVVEQDGELLAGSVVYLSNRVAHTQYLASSARGRALHAMDFLMLKLMAQFSDKRLLDWGTSNEDRGRVLNAGLIREKESCAGRGVAYDTYWYSL